MSALFEDRTTWAPFQVFEYDHKPGHYCLMLSDMHMGPTMDVFAANGRSEGGGYAWADVALQAIRTGKPELESRLAFDPEAGMFVAYGTDLDALKELASRLHAAFHDHAALGALVRDAPYEYD